MNAVIPDMNRKLICAEHESSVRLTRLINGSNDNIEGKASQEAWRRLRSWETTTELRWTTYAAQDKLEREKLILHKCSKLERT